MASIIEQADLRPRTLPPAQGSEPVFHGVAALIEALRPITQQIAERAHEIEEGRRLPTELFEKIAETGFFKMMVAGQYGGAEWALPDVIPIIEEFARADGSTAWSMMLGSEIHIGWTRFPDDLLRQIYASPGAAMTRGALTPKGKVTRVDGGFILDGRWPLASGSYPTDWFLVGGIPSNEAGQPVKNPDGVVDVLLSAVPASEVKILDTWHSMGMRSTESHDIELTNYFVPDDRAAFLSIIREGAGVAGRIPLYTAFGTFHLAVLLGIVRGMLDDLGESAKTKRPMLSPRILMSQSPLFQKRLGGLETRLAAVRAFVLSEAANVWTIAASGETVSTVTSARYRSMVAYVHQECLAIANEAFSDAGTASMYNGSTMQRRFRDIRTACQHVIANTDIFVFLGGLLLGEDVDFNGKA